MPETTENPPETVQLKPQSLRSLIRRLYPDKKLIPFHDFDLALRNLGFCRESGHGSHENYRTDGAGVVTTGKDMRAEGIKFGIIWNILRDANIPLEPFYHALERIKN